MTDASGSPDGITERNAPEPSATTVYEMRSAPNSDRLRLDHFLTQFIPDASRSRLQALIAEGGVTINGAVVQKAGRLVLPGDHVVCVIPKPPPPGVVAEDIPLVIVYEDDDVLVVNKAAGMVTHPAHGNYTGTLVNALLHYTASLSRERGDERAGIMHRLDKGTSGLLCVAKTDRAHRGLAPQFSSHTIEREYEAIVWGRFPRATGIIEAPLARHKSDRKKMAVSEGGKRAVTEYTVLQEYEVLSHVRLRLQTGRTHQIRVHLSHIRHPVLGDATYGGRHIVYGTVTQRYKQFVNGLLTVLPRQALHAKTLGFVHPVTGGMIRLDSPLPPDMTEALARIDAYFTVADPDGSGR